MNVLRELNIADPWNILMKNSPTSIKRLKKEREQDIHT